MNLTDLGDFSEALSGSARIVGRTVGEKEMKSMFNFLINYPLKVVLKAMDRALRKRDPEDIFLKTALVTGIEIEQAIEEIIDESIPEGVEGKVSRCKICNGNGWLTSEDESKRLVAHPCKCLYEAAQEALRKKKRPGSMEARLDQERKRIVASYEIYEKNWGGQK